MHAVDPARDRGPSSCCRGDHTAAATATAGAVLIGVGLVATGAAAGADGEATDAARDSGQRGQHDDRATPAAAAAAVLTADVAGRAIGIDCARAREASGAHQHDAAAGAAGRRQDRVVVAACAATAAQEHAARRAGYDHAAVAAACQVRRPRVAAHAAGTAVATTATARVLTVARRVAIGAAAAGVAGCAASEVAVRVAVADGVDRAGRPLRGAGDAFTLLTVCGLGGGRAVVRVDQSSGAASTALQTGAESLTGHVDRRTVEVEVAGDIEHEDAATRTVPGHRRRRRRRAEGR